MADHRPSCTISWYDWHNRRPRTLKSEHDCRRNPVLAGVLHRSLTPKSRLVEPVRVKPYHVVDSEVLLWIVAFHVVEPDVDDIFPGHRYQRWVLLHDILGAADQCEALSGIDLGIDLVQKGVELGVLPERVVLRPA